MAASTGAPRTRPGGGRRTGRARPHRRCTAPAPWHAGRRGPTSGAGATVPGTVTQIAASRLAHVDPQLQGVGGHHGQQLSGHQARLDLAPLVRRVAGAGREQSAPQGWPARAPPGAAARTAISAPRRGATAGSRSFAPPFHDFRQRSAASASGDRAGAGALVDQRGVPHRDRRSARGCSPGSKTQLSQRQEPTRGRAHGALSCKW